MDQKILINLLERAVELIPMGTVEVERSEEDALVVEINQALQEEKEDAVQGQHKSQ